MFKKYSMRKPLFVGSYYESDQEDNRKDEDYNPNEYFEKVICCGSTSTSSSSTSSLSNTSSQQRNVQRLTTKKSNSKVPVQRVSTRLRKKNMVY